MAALKANDALAADADATAAIGLDATYLKAYQRRAAARQLMGRSLEACIFSPHRCHGVRCVHPL